MRFCFTGGRRLQRNACPSPQHAVNRQSRYLLCLCPCRLTCRWAWTLLRLMLCCHHAEQRNWLALIVHHQPRTSYNLTASTRSLKPCSRPPSNPIVLAYHPPFVENAPLTSKEKKRKKTKKKRRQKICSERSFQDTSGLGLTSQPAPRGGWPVIGGEKLSCRTRRGLQVAGRDELGQSGHVG